VSFVKLKASLIALLATGLGVAHAHPHLRLAYQLDPLLEQGRVTGLHVSWQMDAQNSLLVRENIDLNQNGVLDPDELQAFAQTNQALMSQFNYFLTLEDGASKKPLSFETTPMTARDAGKGFQGGIYLEFTVQLKTATASTDFQMQLQDPTWYIGFEPRLGKVLASASACQSSFTREKRLTPTQGEQEFQRIHVQCAAGSAAHPEAQLSPPKGPNNGVNS